MNIKHVAGTVAIALLGSQLAACSGGGMSGEYGEEVNGKWEPVMTFKRGGEVEIDFMGSLLVGKYEVKDGKVHITGGQDGQTQAFRIDQNGCIDGGMLFGTMCKKPK